MPVGGRSSIDGTRRAVGADLAADDHDGPVGHDHGARIPAPDLQPQLAHILLPVVGAKDARGAVGPVQPQALGGVARPAADVELAAAFVGQDEAGRAEDVGLDVQRAPGQRGLSMTDRSSS